MTVRRLKIAVVSLLLAVLTVAMVGGMVLPVLGVPLTPTPTMTVTPSGVLEIPIAIALASLIYRDIVRREKRGG